VKKFFRGVFATFAFLLTFAIIIGLAGDELESVIIVVAALFVLLMLVALIEKLIRWMRRLLQPPQ
jgi:hypothetical protein